MKPNQTPQRLARQLLICTAISAICHNVYAEESPFADRPLSLIDEFSTKPEYDTGKPSVMLLIDDSGSMDTEVGLGKLTEDNVCKDAYAYLYSTRLSNSPSLAASDFIDFKTGFTVRFLSEEKLPPAGCRTVRAVDPNNDKRTLYRKFNPTGENVLPTLGQAKSILTKNSFWNTYKNGNYSYRFSYVPAYPNSVEQNDITNKNNYPSKFDINGPQYLYQNKLISVNNSVLKAYLWFKDIPSDGKRSDITRAALDKVFNKYGDKLDWNMMSLWGSESRDKKACATDFRNPAVYEYGAAKTFQQKLPTLFGDSYRYLSGFNAALTKLDGNMFMPPDEKALAPQDLQRCDGLDILLPELGISPKTLKTYELSLNDSERQTPLVWRYIQAAQKTTEYVKKNSQSLTEEAKRCRNDFIIVFADGVQTDTFSNGGYIDKSRMEKFKYTTDIYKNLSSSSKIQIDENATGTSDGIAFFSKQLADASIMPNGSIVQTFTIGFGEGMAGSGRTILTNAAQAKKPKSDTIEPGYGYWEAKSAADLDAAFEQIFQNILAQSATNAEETGSTASPGVLSSSSLGAAVLTLNTGNWSSGLKFFKLDNEGNVTGTDTTEPDYSSRKVIMNNGTTNYYLDAPIATANEDFRFANKEEFSEVFLPWLRRDGNSDTALIDKAKTVAAPKKITDYRNRLASVKMNDGLSYQPSAQDREMSDVLATPVIGIKDKSNQYLVTGANDGMVYIFGGSSSALPSTLKLNYLPGSMPRESATDTLAANLYQIAEEGYGRDDKKHIYGVNGGISYVKTAATKDRQQQILLLGSMGQGGRGVYALNIDGCDQTKSTCEAVGLGVINNSSWLTSVPRWEAKAQETGDVKLGYTVGSPVLYQMATTFGIKDGKKSANLETGVYLAGLVGNGFPSKTDTLATDNAPTLYIFDAMGVDQGTSGGSATASKKGSLIKKISVTGSSNTGLLNGLKGQNTLAPPAVIDVDFDGIADLAYAGDYAGNMYRFDFRDGIANAKGVKIYAGESTQPITAAPAIYRESDTKLIVTFGTGSDLFDADLKDKDNQQGFFGIFDDISVASPSAVSRSSLAQQKLSGATAREIEETSVTGKKGWWIPLAAGSFVSTATKDTLTAAEKSVTQPQLLLSTAFFSTLVYRYEETNKENVGSKQCPVNKSGKKSGGSGWLMAVDVKTGGMPKTAKFKSTQNKDKAGIKLDNLISGAVLLDGEVATEMPSALNANGQAQNGELKELHTPPKPLNNTCLTSDANFILLSEVKKGGGILSEAVTGPLCPDPGMLIRLNLRELDNEQ